MPSPEPALTVAAVARKLGVAPSTLRTWDRRYGLGPSAHTAGAHRRYTPGDVARLVVMRRLTMEGVPPGAAAANALLVPAESEPDHRPDHRPDHGPDHGPDPRTEAPDAPAPLVEAGSGPAEPAAEDREPAAARQGGGRVLALGDAVPAARGLARAAAALDTEGTHAVLLDAVAALGVVRAWDTVVMPVLTAVGTRWEATGEGVEVEHALSEAVGAVMRSVAVGGQASRSPHQVLLACSEDDQHSLPVHVLAAALREEGLGCRMFGAGMPASSLVAAVRRCGPAVVFLYARLPVAPGSAQACALEEIPRQRPAPHLVLGGPGWAGITPPRHSRQVADLAAAVDEIVSLIG